MGGKPVEKDQLPKISQETKDENLFPRAKTITYASPTQSNRALLEEFPDYRFVYADEITENSKLWNDARYEINRDERAWVLNGYVEGRNFKSDEGRALADGGELVEGITKVLMVNKEYPVIFQGVSVKDTEGIWISYDENYERVNENKSSL